MCGNQYVRLFCETIDQFIYHAGFSAGGYIWTGHNALVSGSFSLFLFGLGEGQNIERFLQLVVSLWCFYYFHSKVCLQITFGGYSYRVKISKLIWKGLSLQTIIRHLCASRKYSSVLCLSIKGDGSRVFAPLGLAMWRVSWNGLISLLLLYYYYLPSKKNLNFTQKIDN